MDTQFEYLGPNFKIIANAEILNRLQKFKFNNTDVIVATFPKCGTTVVQEIVWHIKNKEKIKKGVQNGSMEVRFPFIEYNNQLIEPESKLTIDVVENDLSNTRLIKTHCPLKFFDNAEGGNVLYDVKKGSSNPKIITVARNPFDTAVSYFHFYLSDPGFEWQGSWDEFFEMFMQGKNLYGSFRDWYLDYTRVIKNNAETQNLLLLKFEDIVINMEGEVKKIAEFLDEVLSEEQLAIIVHNCSFKSMSKEGADNAMGSYAPKFFRKGEIGDYKNYFSPEQFSRCEEHFAKVLKAEGLEFLV